MTEVLEAKLRGWLDSMFTFPVGFAAAISLAASNVAGSTKKSTVLGMILVAYCTGNLS